MSVCLCACRHLSRIYFFRALQPLCTLQEDKLRVGLVQKKGGFLSWLGGGGDNVTQIQDTEGKSFEDLLTDFVEVRLCIQTLYTDLVDQ